MLRFLREVAVGRENLRPARGTLRATSSMAFGARHMGRAITEYLRRYPGVEIDLTLNDRLVSAAIERPGVVLQPSFLLFEALRQKTLVRILPDWEADELAVFAIYPHRKFLPPKVRSFIDFLAGRFRPEPYRDPSGRAK